jgi:hypothetical protein
MDPSSSTYRLTPVNPLSFAFESREMFSTCRGGKCRCRETDGEGGRRREAGRENGSWAMGKCCVCRGPKAAAAGCGVACMLAPASLWQHSVVGSIQACAYAQRDLHAAAQCQAETKTAQTARTMLSEVATSSTLLSMFVPCSMCVCKCSL